MFINFDIVSYFIYKSFNQHIVAIGVPGVPIDEETLKEILYETSKGLKKEEKSTLSKTVKMDKKEEERFKQDPNTLLEIIMMKTKNPNTPFNLGKVKAKLHCSFYFLFL